MRSRLAGLGGLLVGSGLAFLAGTRSWWRALGQGLDVGFSGNQSTGGISQALALVGLAGGLLMLVLGSRGRRVVAAILLLVGGGMATIGLLRLRPSSDAVRTQVRTVSLSDQFSLAATPWPWVYAVAGLLVTLAAATTLARADRWPQRPDRFRRGGDDTGTQRLLDDPADAWRALDAGLDPTADSPEEGAGPKHPDVHSSATSDTMGSTQPSSKADPSAE
jgi:uncharacterized membrane protein (TIGR02234 family)